MSKQNDDSRSINRRTVLRGAGAMSGAALVGTAGVGGVSAGKPCFKDFEGCDDGSYVKVEFVECENYDDDEECPCDDDEDCCFITEKDPDDTGFEITGFHSKEGEDCEPIAVEWSNEYDVNKALIYGGGECDTVPHGGDSGALLENRINSKLVNPGDEEAAISNIQLCVTEDGGFEDLDGYQVDLIYGDIIYDFSAGGSYNSEDRLLQAITDCGGLVDRVDKDDEAYDQCDVAVTKNLTANADGTASVTLDTGSCDETAFNLVSYAADLPDCEFQDSTQEFFEQARGTNNDGEPAGGSVTDNGDGTFTYTVDLPL